MSSQGRMAMSRAAHAPQTNWPIKRPLSEENKETIQEATQALTINPEDVAAYVELVRVYREQGHRDMCRKTLVRGMVLFPRDRIIKVLMLHYFGDHKFAATKKKVRATPVVPIEDDDEPASDDAPPSDPQRFHGNIAESDEEEEEEEDYKDNENDDDVKLADEEDADEEFEAALSEEARAERYEQRTRLKDNTHVNLRLFIGNLRKRGLFGGTSPSPMMQVLQFRCSRRMVSPAIWSQMSTSVGSASASAFATFIRVLCCVAP
jgi:hypothetical protein